MHESTTSDILLYQLSLLLLKSFFTSLTILATCLLWLTKCSQSRGSWVLSHLWNKWFLLIIKGGSFEYDSTNQSGCLLSKTDLAAFKTQSLNSHYFDVALLLASSSLTVTSSLQQKFFTYVVISQESYSIPPSLKPPHPVTVHTHTHTTTTTHTHTHIP